MFETDIQQIFFYSGLIIFKKSFFIFETLWQKQLFGGKNSPFFFMFETEVQNIFQKKKKTSRIFLTEWKENSGEFVLWNSGELSFLFLKMHLKDHFRKRISLEKMSCSIFFSIVMRVRKKIFAGKKLLRKKS